MRPLILCVLLGAALAGAAPKIAAPGLKAVGVEAGFAEFLNEQLAAGLREGGAEVITAREIQTLLGLERQKQLLGCSDDASSCTAELAGALGVSAVVLGDVVQLDRRFQLSVKLLGAEDARLIAAESARVDGKEALTDAIVAAGRKLGAKWTAAPDAGAAPPPATVTAAAAAAADGGSPCGGEWCKTDMHARMSNDKAGFDLTAVAASSDRNVWAVGYGGTVLRFDGERWQEKNTPSELGGILRAVWTSGPQLVIVAGQNGLAYRWKGQGWAAIHEPGYAGFNALHGTADGKLLWAATDKGILRLDGSSWKTAWADSAVADVHAVSATEAWAVAKERVLRFRDGKWTPLKDAPRERLNAVFAVGDDVWFGGDGVVIRHSPKQQGEAAWRRYPVGRTAIVSLWGTRPEKLWAGGTSGALLHFDGEDFVAVSAPGGGTIFSVTGAGERDLWFVQDLPNIRPGSGVYRYRK